MFKKQIVAVLDIWEDWIVFPPDFIASLKSRLDGSVGEKDKSEKEDNEGNERGTPACPARYNLTATDMLRRDP